MGRKDSKKKVPGPSWSKVFYFRKYLQLTFCFHDGALRSFKISEKSLVWILKTMHTTLWAQSWSKKSFFKAFLIVTFVYLQSSVLTKTFRKVLVMDFENSAFEVLDLGVKWYNFGVSKSFYKVFSISILFTYSTLSFKISENL